MRGRPVAFVVATVRRRSCPVYVPDPRWMALLKLWLSTKPQRSEAKKPKDKRQGEVLLDACRFFLRDNYPMDLDFVLDLPGELRHVFDEWATRSGYDPTNPDDGDSGPPTGPSSESSRPRRFRR